MTSSPDTPDAVAARHYAERARLQGAARELLSACGRVADALPEGHQDVLDVLGYVDVRLDARLVSDLFAALKKARA